jgi:hypothetical protein
VARSFLNPKGGQSRHRTYNEKKKSMERITVESTPIVVRREEDGRWWADIESMPGVMAYTARLASLPLPPYER